MGYMHIHKSEGLDYNTKTLHLMSWQNDLYTAPLSIRGDLVCHKVLELFVQANHELCTRCDAVWVKPWLWRQHFTTFKCFLFQDFCLLSWSEPGAIMYFNSNYLMYIIASATPVKSVVCHKIIHLNDCSSNQNVTTLCAHMLQPFQN